MFEKKNYNYFAAELAVSLPWIAFLSPSYPNWARIEFGLYYLAFWGLVFPIKSLNLFMQLSEISYNPTTRSDEINYISWLK